ALERAEEWVPPSEPETLPTFEPAVHSLRGVGGQWGRASLVALPAEHSERAAAGVNVLRGERQRLGDAEPGAEERGQERAVADAGRRAPRAGRAESFHLGEGERLGRKPTGGFSLHTSQTLPESVQCRFSEVPTLYGPFVPAQASAQERNDTLWPEWG